MDNQECERQFNQSGSSQHIPHIFLCAGDSEGGRTGRGKVDMMGSDVLHTVSRGAPRRVAG